MGSGSSTMQRLVERKQLQCDSNGVARFQASTISGGPAAPGYYKIICNVNINQVHVRGIMMNGATTNATFNGTMPFGNSRVFRYQPGTANTPMLKGFSGQFTAIPNRGVMYELQWSPL